MSDAFLSWFRSSRTSAEEFLALAEDLGAIGWTSIHPVLGTASLLNIEGDSVPMPIEEIARLIGLAVAPLTVTWWQSSSSSLDTLFTPNPIEGETQTYYLDGLSLETREELAKGLPDRPDETIGLVLDHRGNSFEYDWEKFMRYGPAALGALPDLLVLSPAVFEQNIPADWRDAFRRDDNGLYVRRA